MKPIFALACASLALATSACGDAEANDDPVEATAEAGSNPLFDTLDEVEGITTAAGLFADAGLETTLEGNGAYTLFVPNDAAFDQLPEEDLARLKSEEGRPELIAILRQHIATGAIAKADLDAALADNDGAVELASVSGAPISVRSGDAGLRIGEGEDGPAITGEARAASNGVIYVIDGLIPPGN